MNFKIKLGLMLCLVIISCAPPKQITIEEIIIPTTLPIKEDIIDDKNTYLNIVSLGEEAINQTEFQQLLSSFRENNFINNQPIIVVKIDDLPLGGGYGSINEFDLALEDGFTRGLLKAGFHITEKLDHIHIRTTNTFSDNTEEGFYLHAIDLDDHKIIQDKHDTNILLEYQKISMENNNSLIVYFRFVDLNKLKIFGSILVKAKILGSLIDQSKNLYVKKYTKTYNLFKRHKFPVQLFRQLNNTAVLNIDILNITGTYSTKLNRDLMAIENGIHSGLINNFKNKLGKNDPFLSEKSSGFKMKYPEVYQNIVFNTNPLIYEDWSEFIDETGCSELFMYRIIEGEGFYVRVIDAQNNGEIIFSGMIPSPDSKNFGVMHNHNFIQKKLDKSFEFNLLRDKRVGIIDGDKHAVSPEKYINSRKLFNQMHLAIEEGFITSLTNNAKSYNFSIHEKLKTLYLKQPWMYEDKIFNMNPLFLNNWSQLRSFGFDVLLVYNNHIKYEKLNNFQKEYKKVALSYKLIDLATGNVIYASEIRND